MERVLAVGFFALMVLNDGAILPTIAAHAVIEILIDRLDKGGVISTIDHGFIERERHKPIEVVTVHDILDRLISTAARSIDILPTFFGS